MGETGKHKSGRQAVEEDSESPWTDANSGKAAPLGKGGVSMLERVGAQWRVGE